MFTTRFLPALCALVITTASTAIGQPLDKSKLRNAISLPRLNVTINFGLTPNIADWWDAPSGGTESTSNGNSATEAASPAARLIHLAKACSARKDDAGATRAYGQAAALLAHQTTSHPNDAESLLEYGKALMGLNRNAEAEPILRRVVHLTPDNWHGWVELGNVLLANSLAITVHAGSTERAPAGQMSAEEIRAWSQRHQPTTAQKAQEQKLMEEGQAAFDKAVAIAPREAEPYFRRASFRIGALLAQTFQDFTAGGANSGGGADFIVKLVQQPLVISDLRQAALLSPNNPRVLAGAATFELFGSLLERAKTTGQILEPGSGPIWKELPPATQQSVHSYVDRLQKLAQTPTTRSASVLDALARVQLLVGDSAASERNFRQAVALDPTYDSAWQSLIAILAGAHRLDDLASLLRQRLKTQDSVFSRLMLAKCLANLDQRSGAEQQVRAALNLAPHDLTADVTLAALLLKTRDTPAALTEAGALLDEVDRLYANSHPAEEWVEYLTIRGIYQALSGNVAAARQTLQDLAPSAPDNEDVRAALLALG